MNGKRIGLSVVLAVLISLNIAAQPVWVDSTLNPRFYPGGGASCPSVLYNPDYFLGRGEPFLYKMWFTSRYPPGIGMAASHDGTNWTILSIPEPGLVNPNHAVVLFDAEYFGSPPYSYRMWYWAQSENVYSIASIHTARSLDGVNWIDDQAITQVGTSVVVDNGTNWNRGSYGPVAVIYNAYGSATLDDSDVFNNRFVMYYDGTTGSQEAWGLAYSVDGLLWKGYNGGAAPVLPAGGTGAWDENFAGRGSLVHIPNGGWELWYGGGVTAPNQGIGHATSPNGIAWTRDPANPLTDLGCPATDSPLGCDGSWNASQNYAPAVLAWSNDDGCSVQTLRMWRSGKSAASGDASYSIGYAEKAVPSGPVRSVPGIYPDIGSAVLAANPGDMIQVAAGTYAENLVIDKPLVIQGAGAGLTTLVPAVSNPDCGGTGGDDPLCGGASHIVLVQSGCVTIRDLTVDGNNPDLTSGVTSGGVDVDARNGILLDRTLDSYDHFTVYNCEVKNIYLMGICAYQTGVSVNRPQINIHDNVMSNVAGSTDYSKGIFICYSAGKVAGNTVTGTPDAISASWSRGMDFLNNTVRLCGSGVHTDNAGSFDYDATDLIQGNSVSGGVRFGSPPRPSYGVWALTPYQTLDVIGNIAIGLDVGLAVHGEGATYAMVSFNGNTVDGQGAEDSVGALVTTDQRGAGSSNSGAFFFGDALKNCDTGLQVDQQTGTTATVWATDTTIAGNRTGVQITGAGGTGPDVTLGGSLSAACTIADNCDSNIRLVSSPSDVAATYNFWGATCESLVQQGIWDETDDPALGAVTYSPWTDAAHTVTYTSGSGPSCEDLWSGKSVTASPWMNQAGAAAQHTIQWVAMAGETRVTAWRFTFPPPYAVHGFAVGATGSFTRAGSATVTYAVLGTNSSSAYVDIDGSCAYTPGTDYPLARVGNAFTLSFPVSGTEPETETRILTLNAGVADNPATGGIYVIPNLFSTSQGSVDCPNASEVILGCEDTLTGSIGDSLRIVCPGTVPTISWDPVAPEPCMSGYAVFASTDCTAWGAFQNITAQDQDLDATDTNFEYPLPTDPLVFFLVREAGCTGNYGPLGHYGL